MATLMQKNEQIGCHLPRHGVAYRIPHMMRPSLSPNASVNQRLPSGPVVIPHGPLLDAGRGSSVMVPLGVMRPILLLLPSSSVNQRLPSGPVVIPPGPRRNPGMGMPVGMWAGGIRKSGVAPLGLMRPRVGHPPSPQQRPPTGPELISPAERV